jgi:hypothetical protein
MSGAVGMAKRAGRPKKPGGEGSLVRLDSRLVEKARKLAALRQTQMGGMLSEVLWPWVDKEWVKEVRKLKDEAAGKETDQ